MNLKYTNTIDDFIEMQCFVDNIYKPRLVLKNCFSISLFAGYIGSVAYILWIVSEMYKCSFSDESIEMGVFCISVAVVTIICISILMKLRPKIYLHQIRRIYKRAIKKRPNLVMEKELIVEADKLVNIIDNSQNQFYFEDIYKVFENKNNIYIFSKNYRKALVIPEKAFKDNNEKLDFLRMIEKNIQL